MRRPAVLLACLAVLTFFHMREAVLEGRVYFERDIHLQWYGQVESFVHAIGEGAWPLWDPWPGFGQPMLANANTQVLYPPTWLNLVMIPETYYRLYLFFHLVLGGAGVSALSRRLGCGWLAATVAGGVFLVSGPFLSLGNAWNHLAGAAWMPWIAVAGDRLASRPGPRGASLLALPVAAALLAGSPDLATLGLAGAALLMTWRARHCGASVTRVVCMAVFGFVLAGGLAAAQLLPSLELVSRSARSALAPDERDHWSLHPVAAAQLAIPVTLQAGTPLPPEWREVLFEGREPYLFSIYCGVPALLLAGLGCRSAPGTARLPLIAAAFLALLWSFGRFSPFQAGALAVAPFLGMFRFPVKAVLLMALAIALLAGLGIEALRREPLARGPALALVALAAAVASLGAAIRSDPLWASIGAAIVMASALLVAAVAVAALPSRTRATLLGVLALAELSAVHRHLNPTAPADFYRGRPAALADVPAGDTRRFLAIDYSARADWPARYLGRPRPYVVAARQGSRSWWAGAMAVRLYPVAPVPAAWRVPGSYSRDLLGLLPPALVSMNDALTSSFPGPEFVRLLQAGGVAHLATLHDVEIPGLVPLRRVHGPFFEDIRIYGVSGASPRVRFEAALPDRSSLDALLHEAPPPQAGSARIASFRSDRVRIDVDAAAAGRVVLIDAWDPGWRASLDGTPVAVEVADLAFRGVRVPQGRHVLEMAYRPGAASLGVAVSALGVLLTTLAARARGD